MVRVRLLAAVPSTREDWKTAAYADGRFITAESSTIRWSRDDFLPSYLWGNCIMLHLIKIVPRPFREEACGLHNGYLIPRCSIRSSRKSAKVHRNFH